MHIPNQDLSDVLIHTELVVLCCFRCVMPDLTLLLLRHCTTVQSTSSVFIGSSHQRGKKTSEADTLFSVSLSAVHPNDDGFLVVSDDLLPVYTPRGKEAELLGEPTSLQGLMGPVCLFSEPLSPAAVQQLSSTSKPALTVLLLSTVLPLQYSVVRYIM